MKSLHNTKNWLGQSSNQFIRSSLYLLLLLAFLSGLQYTAYQLFSFSNINQLTAWNLFLLALSISLIASYIATRSSIRKSFNYWGANFLRLFPAAVVFAVAYQAVSNLSQYAGLVFYMFGLYCYFNFACQKTNLLQSIEQASSRLIRNPIESIMLYLIILAVSYVQQNMIGGIAIVSNVNEAFNYSLYNYVEFFMVFVLYNANKIQQQRSNQSQYAFNYNKKGNNPKN